MTPHYQRALTMLLIATAGAKSTKHKHKIVPQADPTKCVISTMADVATCKKSSSIVVSNLAVPGGQSLDLNNLFTGTTVTFEGITTFGHAEWLGPLVTVSGSHILVTGAGILDGNGQAYWDDVGFDKGVQKPKFFAAHSLDNSAITGITLRNLPNRGFSITSDNLTISGTTLDNSAGAEKAHNTDGFNISNSDRIVITNNTIINQDDCFGINSGTHIEFSHNICKDGHGIAIGSVGAWGNNVVDGVKIHDCTVINSSNGVRIKTIVGGTGTVNNITFSNIELSSISDYGFVVQQDYANGRPSGHASSGVTITGVTTKNIHGSIASSAQQVYITCGTKCSDFDLSGVKLAGGSHGRISGLATTEY